MDAAAMNVAGPFPKGEGMRAVLFDFDGTLAVPTLDFGLMRRQTLQALNPFARGPFEHGTMLMEEVDRVCAMLSPEEAAQARKAAYQAIEDVEMQAARRSSLFPFVRPVFEALRRRNIAIGIITRNFKPAVFTVFPDLGEFSSCVLTRYDVEKVKPHPEHLLKAFSVLHLPAASCLMVGDHVTDIQVGKNAGSRTAGVFSGESSPEQLKALGPDYLAQDTGELMRLIGVL